MASSTPQIQMLHHADASQILPSISDSSVDMILTDPPYNTTSLQIDKTAFSIENYMDEFKRVMKPNGWLFCFGSIEMGAILLKYFKFKFQYLWLKPNGTYVHAGAKIPIHVHENLWVMFRDDLEYVSNLYMDKLELRTAGAPYTCKTGNSTEFSISQGHESGHITVNTGYREGTTVLKFPNKPGMPPAERTDHPTQKPLDMIKMLCKAYCPEDGLVLDPFMGSGTTPLAAKITGRRYVGIEIDDVYYKDAKDRVNNYVEPPDNSKLDFYS